MGVNILRVTTKIIKIECINFNAVSGVWGGGKN